MINDKERTKELNNFEGIDRNNNQNLGYEISRFYTFIMY